MDNSIKILRASAGSGKTYRLAYEYIAKVVRNPNDYSKILAVTFTNKATEEMKGRILSRLNDLSNGVSGSKIEYMDALIFSTGLAFWQVKENARLAKSYILHDYSNFAVSTIDKFFQRIARSFFKELHLDFRYEVETSQQDNLEEAVERILERAKKDDLLNALVQNAVAQQLEKNNWDIRSNLIKLAEILTKEGYKKLTSSPNELIGKLAYAKEVLHLKGVELNMEATKGCDFIAQHNLSVADFAYKESGFVGQLYKFQSGIYNKECGSRYLNACQSSDGWFSKSSPNRSMANVLEPVLKPILENVKSLSDAYIILNNGVEAIERNFSLFLLLDVVGAELDKIYGEQNKLPLFKTTDLISEITKANHIPFIYEKLGAHYKYYMIDEFQDTSSKQWDGFKPLLEEALSSSNDSVMLIGDVKQAIYRWRGGDWNILANQIGSDFIGRVNESESLTTNWRSAKEVINFNNSLFGAILQSEKKKLEEKGVSSTLLSSAYNEYIQDCTNHEEGYVEVRFTDERERSVLEHIRNLTQHQGYRLKDIAILTRRRVESNEIANLLVNNGYNVLSNDALLLINSAVIGFMVSLLRFSCNTDNILYRAQVNMHLYDEINDKIKDREIDIIKQITTCNIIKALEIIIKTYSLEDKEVAYLQAFYDNVYNFCIKESGDIGQFIQWWDKNSSGLSLAVPKGQDAITIITIHKAKGLQYPIVLIPYADWSMESNHSTQLWTQADDEPLNEMGDVLVNYVQSLGKSPFSKDYFKELIYSRIDSLNLLYVAVTRAESELYLIIGDKVEKESVGEVIKNTIAGVTGLNLSIGEDQQVYSFGSKGKKTTKNKDINEDDKLITIDSFEIENADLRIATRMPYYKLEDEQIDNREMGVIMHNLFSKVVYEGDFGVQIEFMRVNGEISQDLAAKLRAEVDLWMSNGLIKEWFSDKWTVYSERSILTKDFKRRPDRVVVKDDSATIVDYKFGTKESKIYQSQVKEYAELLHEMGYKEVKSYIWYVTLNQIVTL